MRYTLDLRQIPLEKYLTILKRQNLLPGRRILLNDIDLNFQSFKDAGVSSTYELKGILSTPSKLATFSSLTGVAENYLVILKRELGSLAQKPVLLDTFPGLSGESISKLQIINIKTTKDFFDLYHSSSTADAVENISGIGGHDINELYCLCNLVRINGIGPTAARTMFESGYKRIADIAGADAEEMLSRITAVNSTMQYYQAKLGVKDMRFIIDAARLVLDIEEQY